MRYCRATFYMVVRETLRRSAIWLTRMVVLDINRLISL